AGSVLLQATRGDESREAVRVFAVVVLRESGAVAAAFRPVDVDVVDDRLGIADLLEGEPAAEVGPQLFQDVLGRFLADPDLHHARRLGGQPEAQADAALRLLPRLALTRGRTV